MAGSPADGSADMIAPARAAAYRALRLVERGDLGDTLARTRDPLEDPRDRALATDLVTGSLRWRGAIDYQLAGLSGKALQRLDPEVLAALRLGAYQLLYLERLPASAVVNDSVDLVKTAGFKSAAPFVNAVLRRLVRERNTLQWPGRNNIIEHLAVVHSHPAWLVTRWVERYGAETAETWVRFNNTPASLTLAVNCTRTDREGLIARLRREGIVVETTRIAPHGVRVIKGRPAVSAAFKDGLCVVQDEASQLIPEVVAAQDGSKVLDACAAPGGKTVALSAQVGSRGLVVATDVRARRMGVLQATLARCRITNARAVQISTRGALPFREDAFDVVLLDAPCSGLGTLRRDPDIKWKRAPEDLEAFSNTQVELLRRVAPVVAPGGRIVYSTCSSEPDENELVVRRFLNESPGFVLQPLQAAAYVSSAARSCATPDGFLRTDPARDGLEAFFAAIVERIVR